MKKTMVAFVLALWLLPSAFPQSVTNVSVGVDLNATAWTKVNNNNNALVGWHNAQVASNAWFYAMLTNTTALAGGCVTNLTTVSNAFHTFLATNIPGLAPGAAMNFDAGKITSDGAGALNLNYGNLYITNTANNSFYIGPGAANPGVGLTAWGIAANVSGSAQFAPTYAALVVRQGLNGPPYAGIYSDYTGAANINGGPSGDSCLLAINADGTLSLIDYSGTGQHFDGSGNATFDNSVSFLGGAATITSDTAGNGGTTLMLQASDNGQPLYLHVDSSGTLTVTTSP